MKTFLLLCQILLTIQAARASHLLGGYMQAKPVAGSAQTYLVTVALYLDEVRGQVASSQTTSLSVCFGDGTIGIANRQSQVLVLSKTVSLNMYQTTHTYYGPGTYVLTTSLPGRSLTQNITDATNQLFTLGTTIFTNTTLQNQTPTPGFPEAGFHINLNQKAVLPLKATDAEGDSLVYGLTKPLTSTYSDLCVRRAITTYKFPNDVTQQGTFKLNNRTGDLVWDVPTREGFYSVALTVDEYRNGVLISQTLQEVPLFVEDRPGTPAPVPPYEPAIEGAIGIVTGITTYADADVAFTAFPNPVNDRLQVVIQTSNPTTATLQLIDISGRKRYELVIKKLSRQHEHVIDMDGLAPGVYLLRANVGERSLVQKIVKQ
ncbi:T9SS type A sorting domain-containing protein [Spirosoma jeollabukense]